MERRPANRSCARTRLGCCLTAVLALAATAGATDGLEPIGVSMQSQARGGADVAVGDSPLSQVDNPATLSLTPRWLCRLDASGQVAYSLAEWRGPIDASASEKKWIMLGNLGVAVPVDERLTLGFALHSKAGLGSRYRMRHLMIPLMRRDVGSDMKCLGLLFNVSYKLTDKLAVGAGARAEMAASKFSTVLGPADLEFGSGCAYGAGYQLGLHYQAREDLAFGLAYRSPSWYGDLAGGAGRASLFGLLPVPLGDIHIEDVQLPQKVTAGVAWDATCWLKLVGEVRWLNYASSTFRSMTLATEDPFNIRYPFPLGYRDQWAFIGGAEIKLDEHWILGLGYHYGTEPVSAANLLPMGSTIPNHHATVGLRYERDRWWVGAAYVVAFPATLHGPGWSDIPGGIDYGCSEITQAQHSLVLGLGFSW